MIPTGYNGHMESESPQLDDVSRFAALRDESHKLLDAAKTLVGEMRLALDHCKRHRPCVEAKDPGNEPPTSSAAVKSHRGGRVGKKKSRRRFPRPR
jgi:hypothetical protein